MYSIDPATMSERENYKFLTGTIVPRPIAFVTTVGTDGTINAAPFSFFNIVSSNPPLVSLSVQRKNGKQKDTARNIVDSGEYVIHIVDESNVDEVNKTAASLPAYESELDLTNFTMITSSVVGTPAVQEAKVRMECRLEKAIPLGGDNKDGCDLLIGNIVAYHIDENLYDSKGHINQEELAAVSRLAGNQYAKMGEFFSIERPE
ncbi:flavin reductase family protein [Bacillus sp. 1P06AnD]|uniref:flavin reductase family protein n=1 Tax=Bacillus sp. 1P06AnD TaxID=3132208 RepID=UPI0039A0765B